MKASEIFYRHDMTTERGYRFHVLTFYCGEIRDLASQAELQREGVDALKKWFDEFGTSKQVCLEGEELKIRFQQSFDKSEWSDCYAARIEQAELSDRHLKLLGKLIKILDCPVGGFDLSLRKAITALQVAGARQITYRNRSSGAIVEPGAEHFIEHEFHDIPADQIPERFRDLVEAA